VCRVLELNILCDSVTRVATKYGASSITYLSSSSSIYISMRYEDDATMCETQ